MPFNRPAPDRDRGVRGIFRTRPTVLRDSAWIDPAGGPVMSFEDFIADHIAEDSTVTVNQSGTPLTAAALSATAGPAPVGHGGWLAGKTDDVDNEIDEVALGGAAWLNPTAQTGGMIVCEIGFVIPTALTARGYFFGFGDATTGGADDDGMLAITSGTTLVSGATGDAAGFVYSSEATDANAFYMGAVKATAVGTAVLPSTYSSGDADLQTMVVDDYTKLRVEIDSSGNVYFYGRTDKNSENRRIEPRFQGSQAAAVTANVLYVPIFSARSTTTTGVEWEIDYIFGAGSA